MSTRRGTGPIRVICAAFLVMLSAPALAKTIWVSKGGNDAHGCTNGDGDACLTIQRGISLAMPGDTVMVKRGVYVENAAQSQFTNPCTWIDAAPVSLCIQRSGQYDKPIVIQAAQGDERQVIVDSQNVRIGLHMASYDYVHVRGLTFKNNYIIGIASWGHITEVVADDSFLSIGVVVDGCDFYNTNGPEGVNISAIGMWGSKDWIVRNNRIVGVSSGGTRAQAGIQAYGVVNALIEHNELSDVGLGVFWKDHYVADSTRRPVFESEIRFNKIKASANGIVIGVRGSGTVEAGENYIHHNIIYGYGSDGAGVFLNMAAAYAVSGPIRISHNLFHGTGGSTRGVSLDSSTAARFIGNISVNTSLDLMTIVYSTSKTVKIVESDYNVFDSTFQIILDRYGSVPSVSATSLAAWQSLTSSAAVTLGVDFPDRHSRQSSFEKLFASSEPGNYRYAVGSPAIGMMADGSNAGPYQTGNEVIGIRSGPIAAAPVAPSGISVD